MRQLDPIDLELLRLIQDDDRLSLAELGKRVGLVASSVNDRIKHLVEHGVITGFHAVISAEALNLELLAFVFVGWSDPAVEGPFLEQMAAEPSVQECHHVTGAWNYLLKVRLRNTRGLEDFRTKIVTSAGVQRTETLIVLSSPKETMALPFAPEDVPTAERGGSGPRAPAPSRPPRRARAWRSAKHRVHS